MQRLLINLLIVINIHIEVYGFLIFSILKKINNIKRYISQFVSLKKHRATLSIQKFVTTSAFNCHATHATSQ